MNKKYPGRNPVVDKCNSTAKGTNLVEVRNLATKVGLHYRVAKREAGAPLVVPSVVHWKAGHFAALLRKDGEKYHVEDATFDEKGSLWVHPDVFDRESDGYFLVAEGPLPQGWSEVDDAEAARVWGKGVTLPCTQFKQAKEPKTGGPPGQCSIGMAVPSAFKLEATLNLMDTPLSYSPPVGPTIAFQLNYNDQEGNQPGTFSFSNFGQDWSINWGAYLTLDGSQNATVRPPGGGYQIYNYTVPDNLSNPYAPDLIAQTTLTLTSVGVYQRALPDGSIEVYNQPDGTGRIFMTQLIDAQGNSAFIQYDANFRIATITDAIGQVSTFTYASNTLGNVGFYKITKITDPFSRSANFAYDSTTTFLTSSTDVIGIASQFFYDTSSSFISVLTTPYGQTRFVKSIAGDGAGSTLTSLTTYFPDGTFTCITNVYGYYSQSMYWDREQNAAYPFDHARGVYNGYAEKTHWLTTAAYVEVPVSDSNQRPLESAYTYSYVGSQVTSDGDHGIPGPSNKPNTVSVNINSQVQTYSYLYNAFGRITQSIDPLNRQFNYFYAANNIDLLEKRQTQGTNNDLIGKWIFNNTQHVPNTYIDGSGRKTLYTYNNFGQLLTLTDANGSVWTRSYNSDGFLTQIDGPLPGNSDVTTFTYDGFNRLFSVTDSEGYTKTFLYDNADRITQVAYPDGTTEQTVYSLLDAVLKKDRINRWTQDSYDSMDQLSFEIDPLGRKTSYTWCACGSMSSLTDGNGNETSFAHDLNGRLLTKTYADAHATNYSYDAIGRLGGRTDALGQGTTYSYNLDNTLSSVSYSNAINPTSTVNYTWDPNYVRLLTVANGWGTYTYSYNPYITDPFGTPVLGGGMLSTVLNSTIPNATVGYLYDALGRTTNRQINGSSNSVTWAYDPMSRVTSEANTLGTFNYHYVDDVTGSSKGTSRLASINYPNGQITNFTWYGTSQDERLQGITNLDPAGKTRSQFNYEYDSAGEIVRWPQQNAGMTAVNSVLNYDPAGQLVSSQGTRGNAPTNASQYGYSYDQGANRTSNQSSTIQTVSLSGTVTTGNTLTLTVTDSGLTGGQELVNYVVVAGDTLTTIATKFAAAITADANLQNAGVNASSSATVIKVKSVSPNVTSYAASTSGGATEVLTLNVNGNQIQNATIGVAANGYQTRASDVLTLKVFDVGLTGGTESVAYTVPADNTALTTVASGIASAVNADTHLSALGITATSAASVVSLKSSSPNVTTYGSSITPTVASATESLLLGSNTVGNTTATVGGTVTVGDVLSLTVRSNSLTGGSETIVYKVPSGATTTTIAAGLTSAINADAKFVAFGLTATSSAAVITISSSPTYSKATSGGATETITLGSNTNGNTTATIGGTITAGNTVSLKVSGAGLAAIRTETYTVLSTDTLSTIATALTSLVNADATLKTLGVSASANAAVVNIAYNPINYAQFQSSVSGGATETIALTMNSNVNQLVSVSGTVTAGDVISVAVSDFGLTGGTKTDTYTVASGDTPTTIASGISSALNADTSLQAIGVSATATGSTFTLSSNSTSVTSYKSFISSGATESLLQGGNPNGVQTMAVGGTKTTGNVLTLNVFDAGLSASKESVSYTVLAGDTTTTIATAFAAAINADTNLQAIGVTATSSSTVVNIKSTSVNATTYSRSTSAGATETLTLAPVIGVTQSFYNELNELIASGPGGAVNLQGSTNKAVKSVTTNSQTLTVASTPPISPYIATYTSSATNSALFVQQNYFRGSVQFFDGGFGSGPSVGTTYFVNVFHPNLPNGKETVSYTTVAADTYSTIATNIAAAITSDVHLQAIGLVAAATSQTCQVSPTFPTYSTATSVGATETLSVGTTYEGRSSITVGGTVTAGDTVSVVTHYSGLTGQQETVTYTVVAGDTVNSIAAALVTALNADTHLQQIDLSSVSSNTALLTSTQTFTGTEKVAAGPGVAVVTAVDGGANTKSNSYQISTPNTPSASLTFDLNGNMTSDGTNTYQWDAENRLVQINYPGTGNNSQFTYDGLGRRVSILELTSGSTTSAKQFVWCSDNFRPYQPCEARNASGVITSQYYSRGQTIAGSHYFYMPDGLATRSDFAQRFFSCSAPGVVFDPTPITGSVREMTDSSGNIQDERTYDLFGRVMQIQGSLSSDFQFGGYYKHQPSGLNLTLTRTYDPIPGRFNSRDFQGERVGTNLYAYMNNHPEIGVDPSGQCAIAIPIVIGIGLTGVEGAGLTLALSGLALAGGDILGGVVSSVIIGPWTGSGTTVVIGPWPGSSAIPDTRTTPQKLKDCLFNCHKDSLAGCHPKFYDSCVEDCYSKFGHK